MAERQEAPPQKLPRRDWVLLPLVVLLVTAALLGISEAAARAMFPERSDGNCGVFRNGTLPYPKGKCVEHVKNPEGPLIDYHFNECGYRSTNPCGPKPRDMVRIALIGSSITMGVYVADDETFGVRTEKSLRRMCDRSVEVDNLGAVTELPTQPEIASKALELSPDVMVLTVAPFDLELLPDSERPSHRESIQAHAEPPWQKLIHQIRDTKLVFAIAHFMLLDPGVLYRNFAGRGGSREVMNFPPTPSEERTYAEFGEIVDRIMGALKGSGVPLLVAAVPNRVAAAMVSNDAQIAGTDPRWFGRHLTEIATQHGALSLDMTPYFAASPHAEQLFYPVDNHPTGDAHAIMAKALTARLTDGSIPQLAACSALRGAR